MNRLLLLLLFIPVSVFAQPPSKGFKIEGKLDGYADGTKLTLIENGTSKELGSAKMLKGKFMIRGKVEEPQLTYIMIEGVEKPIELYLENSDISVKGTKLNKEKYDISGSSSHKDFLQFTTVFIPLYQQISTLVSTINNTPQGAERDKLMQSYTGMQATIQAAFDKYVKEHTNSYVTPFVLTLSLQFNDDVAILESRYNSLSERLRNSKGGKEIASTIAEKKIGAVGSMAMDFTQNDTADRPVSLSSFRGKYVLVDFWASWCGPCRNENPNVVENFNNFRNKNFTILGVSLDRPGQKEKWLQAIAMDNLTWTHVSDLKFWDNAVAKQYHISSIPQNLLIDPQGKIIGRNLRGADLRAKLCEIFGCN